MSDSVGDEGSATGSASGASLGLLPASGLGLLPASALGLLTAVLGALGANSPARSSCAALPGIETLGPAAPKALEPALPKDSCMVVTFGWYSLSSSICMICSSVRGFSCGFRLGNGTEARPPALAGLTGSLTSFEAGTAAAGLTVFLATTEADTAAAASTALFFTMSPAFTNRLRFSDF